MSVKCYLLNRIEPWLTKGNALPHLHREQERASMVKNRTELVFMGTDFKNTEWFDFLSCPSSQNGIHSRISYRFLFTVAFPVNTPLQKLHSCSSKWILLRGGFEEDAELPPRLLWVSFILSPSLSPFYVSFHGAVDGVQALAHPKHVPQHCTPPTSSPSFPFTCTKGVTRVRTCGVKMMHTWAEDTAQSGASFWVRI